MRIDCLVRDNLKNQNLSDIALYYEAKCNDNLPLFQENFLPEAIIKEHYSNKMAPSVFVYNVKGGYVGGASQVFVNKRLYQHPCVHPQYMSDIKRLPDHYQKAIFGSLLENEPEVIISDIPLVLPIHHHYIYGHFILENITRIYLTYIIGRMGYNFRVVLPNQIPFFMRGALTKIFGQNILWYDAEKQVALAPSILLPSAMQDDYYFHPAANLAMDFWRDVLLEGSNHDQEEASKYAFVYLSRAKMPPRDWRRLINEPEVDHVLRDLGFTVVYPEQLSLSEQMLVFSNMKCCISEYGSASHNMLFADRSTKSMVINSFSHIQSRVAQLRGQHLAVHLPEDGNWRRGTADEDTSYSVNIQKLREDCKAFFSL